MHNYYMLIKIFQKMTKEMEIFTADLTITYCTNVWNGHTLLHTFVELK
jgi:hypothetical protein